MNECCICYNPTQSVTASCLHPLCKKCTTHLLQGGTSFKCPYCRQSNISIDEKYIDVQTINGGWIKILARRFKTYLFNNRYKRMMEQHVKNKYNNFFTIYKFTKIIKFGQEYKLLSDLDTTSAEYIFFCEVVDLPLNRMVKHFLIDYFKDMIQELQQQNDNNLIC